MARSVASGRTQATNRVAVQDVKSSLNFATPGTNKLVTPLACSVLNNGYTLACYVSPNVLGKKHYIFKNGIGNDKMWFNVESNGAMRMYNQELSSPSLVTAANKAQVGKYLHAVATFDATTGKRVIYVNGTSVATDTTTGTLTLGAEPLNIGGKTDVTNDANAKLSNAQVWNRALTADEVSSLYKSGIVPTSGLSLNYKLDEGAGTTAYDTSGNGNHGTITAGTYTADVPTKKRELVGGNMVYNGDFEYAPPFVAAQTATGRWLDGTAAASATKTVFDWAVISGGASPIFSVSIDDTVRHSGTKSLKIVTGDATGWAAVSKYTALGGQTKIPCLPNTSYTLSGWVKTTAGGYGGATIRLRELNGADGIITTTLSTSLLGANDWTLLKVTVTTNAATRFLLPMLVYDPRDIGTAWFDDITLAPTVNTTRTAV